MTTLSAIDPRRTSLRAKLGQAVIVVCLATLTTASLGCGDTTDSPSDPGVEATAGAATPAAIAGASESSGEAVITATAGVAGSSSEAATEVTAGASDGQQSDASSEDASERRRRVVVGGLKRRRRRQPGREPREPGFHRGKL